MRVPSSVLLTALVASVSHHPIALQAASIQSLGDFAEGYWSRAFAVSADGQVVSGISYLMDGSRRAFRWTATSGLTDLGSVGGASDNGATAMSRDGSVVAGFSGSEGFRWTESGGLQTLGHLGSNLLNTPLGANGDGSVLVGYDATVPFVWRSSTGLAPLPLLPNLSTGIAGAITPDALFIGGNLGRHLVRWTGTTPVSLADFSTDLAVNASTISSEGTVIGGRLFKAGANATEALLWVEGVGTTFLPDLAGGDANAAVLGVTADGLTRVGFGSDQRFWTRATVWSDAGLQSLEQVLAAQGIDLSYWYSLDEAFAVSPDGRFIVGSGTVAATFYQEAFIAEITPLATPIQTPFGGTFRSLPGRIQAEDYDVGGPLVPWFDTTPGNSGGQYRSDSVDLFSNSDTQSPGTTLRLSAREWTEYSVNVTATGNQVLRFRIASSVTGGSLNVFSAPTAAAAPVLVATVTVPNTGSTANYRVIESNVSLAPGQQVLRVSSTSTDVQINWFELVTRGVAREVWTGVNGNKVSQIPVTRAPSFTNQLPTPETPVNWADRYGTRLRAYITAPTTGTYRFWIASDDSSSLLLSTTTEPANRKTIASVNGLTLVRQWNKYSSQRSVGINLVAGQIYYLEALQKESTGSDHLSVGWSRPGQSISAPSEIIPTSVLSPFTP